MQHLSPMAAAAAAHPTVVQDLMEGQKMANQLKALLPAESHGSTAGALVEDISNSFSRAIALLQAAGLCALAEHDVAGKRKPAQPARRGGYKRRTLSEGRKVLKSNLDDGSTWRKYGQKNIFRAKFPRSYFRCSHKFDQSCQATRQVQRAEHDPSVYEITYIGDHTCDQAQLTNCPAACSEAGSSSHADLLSFGAHVQPAAVPASVKQQCCDVYGEDAPSAEPSQDCISAEPGGHAVTSTDMDEIFSMLLDGSYI